MGTCLWMSVAQNLSWSFQPWLFFKHKSLYSFFISYSICKSVVKRKKQMWQSCSWRDAVKMWGQEKNNTGIQKVTVFLLCSSLLCYLIIVLSILDGIFIDERIKKIYNCECNKKIWLVWTYWCESQNNTMFV